MGESLPAFLKRSAQRNLDYLVREAAAVDAADALRGRREDWPDQRWGIGQNGSIAGIVYHVCAWKQLSLPLFSSGGTCLRRADFNAAMAPDPEEWPALRQWLGEVGAQWNAALEALPAAEFDAPRDWEGASLTVAEFAAELIKHDTQHAAQIEYLRQLYTADSASRPLVLQSPSAHRSTGCV